MSGSAGGSAAVGSSGTGANIFRGHDNVQGATDVGPNPDSLPGYYGLATGAWKHFARVWNVDYDWIKSQYASQAMMEKSGTTVSRWIDAVLESDGHGGKAGYVTRVQAFLHSVRAWRAAGAGRLSPERIGRFDKPLPHSLDAGYDRFFFGHVGGGLKGVAVGLVHQRFRLAACQLRDVLPGGTPLLQLLVGVLDPDDRDALFASPFHERADPANDRIALVSTGHDALLDVDHHQGGIRSI